MTKTIPAILPQLKAFALSLTKNEHNAEDLTHDVVLKILEKKHLYKEGTSLKAWAFTIMKNEFINQCRNKKPIFINPDPITPSSDTYIIDEIRTLKNKFKISFLMHYHGYKYKEIANFLNVPIGTVKARVFKARQLLKTKIAA
jgi:DNA-directed RNA polymerase specialized sigma24 family protein